MAVNPKQHSDYNVVDNIDSNHPSSSRINEGDFVTQTEEQNLSRGLEQRHISLIAIAGAIVCLFTPHNFSS